MSKFVNQMKDVLTAFNTTAQQMGKRMELNRLQLSVAAAGDANIALQAEMNKAAQAAQEKIDAVHAAAREAVRKWAEPTGVEINDADMKLIDGGIQMTAEDLQGLLVKHQDNGTMVNAIEQYAKVHGVILGYVPNVEDKLNAYGSFAGSAGVMIGRIVEAKGLPDNDYGLALWGKPENISSRMELAIYGIKAREVEPVAQPKATFDFGFRHLIGR